MNEQLELAAQFEANRRHLAAVAYRMLGSQGEADDAVQEAWLRLDRSDAAEIDNLGGWLRTVVARVCLDMLRARQSRREDYLGDLATETLATSHAAGIDPAREAEVADSVGHALLVVLETLTPAERLAFVLHDTFGVSFDEIAPMVGRSTAAARQLASRARRRVQGRPGTPAADVARHRAVISAFLAASREGNFAALLALLDPGIVLRADHAAVQSGATAEVRGPQAVAETFSGRARVAQLALVGGEVGATWSAGGTLRVVFSFTVVDGRIAEIGIDMEPAYLGSLDVEILAG